MTRKGESLSDNHKTALREAAKRRWAKQEEHDKISKSLKNFYQSEAGKIAIIVMKNARKGDTPWNKGKKTPDDVRKKQSEARKQYYQTEEGKAYRVI